LGGPSADCGVTGRKIICDTYGGAARRVVKKNLARKAEIQVAYAIGEARPLSVFVETFGTGTNTKIDISDRIVYKLLLILH